VRRLLNVSGEFRPRGQGPLAGPPEQWAEELADLALTEGVSVFILGTDDPDDLRRFAAEVAPAVRELVDAERSSAVGRDPGGDTGRATGGRDAGGRDAGATVPTVAAPAPGAFAVVPTPDDGRRRSTVHAWDEATRPAGPPRDDGRSYSAGELAAGQHLVDVHDALRAELTQLHQLIAQVAAGTLDPGAARSHIAAMTLRQNRWTLGAYCESYCRIVTMHHTLEDRSMFPHLRAGDPRLGPVIDRLEQEHEVIAELLERVDRALVEFVSVPDGMPGLRAAVDLLSDALLSHLSYEERELVEPLARLGMG
jgi:iron-sulfur cluster repair protein YtfE (RIC family)